MPGELDSLVADALAGALPNSAFSPGPMATTSPMPRPSLDQLPSVAPPGELPSESPAPSLSGLLATPERAMRGDQASVERLGRSAARRDPLAGTDPLPWGRDSVTYSTSTVATGREAGIHWPERIAFRLSDDFPAGPFDPFAAAGHAAENALPAARFPIAVPVTRIPDGWLEGVQPALPPTNQASELPPWLPASTPNAAPPAPASIDGLPTWLFANGHPIPQAPRQHTAPSSPWQPGLRADFPALQQQVNGQPLVWLDNAATTQKPRAVIAAIAQFYARDNSDVHRGAHALATRATNAYESAREPAQRFLGARSPSEIVFTRGATEAITLVAHAWGRQHLRAGDVVLVTHPEHHSNIVPWLQVCEATGALLRVVPVDVTAIGADFYVFSGHKSYGPTGIGALYGREDALAETPPWQGGGSMIEDVTFERVNYAAIPTRFEAGTPNLADAVGLQAALTYVEQIGRPALIAHEQRLLGGLLAGLTTIAGLTRVGAPKCRAGAVSFVIAGLSAQAIGKHLDRHGIAVRSGHHCAQPILRRFGHEATVRPSLGVYNDDHDIARLIEALRRLK